MPEFSPQAATPAEYCALRAATGLGARSAEAAEIGLQASLYGVWLRQDTRLVGMGRIIGDGGCFAQVTDIAVAPEFQRQGWGQAIVARLNAWCDQNLPAGCYLSLIADPGAERLYAAAGFVHRTGMARVIP